MTFEIPVALGSFALVPGQHSGGLTIKPDGSASFTGKGRDWVIEKAGAFVRQQAAGRPNGRIPATLTSEGKERACAIEYDAQGVRFVEGRAMRGIGR